MLHLGALIIRSIIQAGAGPERSPAAETALTAGSMTGWVPPRKKLPAEAAWHPGPQRTALWGSLEEGMRRRKKVWGVYKWGMNFL